MSAAAERTRVARNTRSNSDNTNINNENYPKSENQLTSFSKKMEGKYHASPIRAAPKKRGRPPLHRSHDNDNTQALISKKSKKIKVMMGSFRETGGNTNESEKCLFDVHMEEPVVADAAGHVTTEKEDIVKAMKSCLHSAAIPDELIGRQKEFKFVQSFWKDCYLNSQAGSLYISGSPGTGKTATVDMVEKEIRQIEKENKVQAKKQMPVVKINCMSVITPRAIYTEIYTQLTGGVVSQSTSSEAVESELCLDSDELYALPMVTVILDEVDALSTKDKSVLYHLFELPKLKYSRLILIGIANTLDLTDRLLPRLRAKSCEPLSITFNPYTKSEIVAILQGRISSASENYTEKGVIADQTAVELCARKVSATSGDIRQALDVLRKAVGIAAEQVKPADGKSQTTIKVSVAHVLAVFKGLNNSAVVTKVKGLPLHHMIILLVYTTFLIENVSSKAKRMTVGKLHEQYASWCREHIGAPVSNSDVTDMLEMLQGLGILTVATRPANIRQREINLRADIKDIRTGVSHDDILKGHILSYDEASGKISTPE
eukprot:CFRG4325T1